MARDNFLVDTDLLIDHLKGKAEAKETLRVLARRGRVFFSVLSEAEIYAGVRKGEEGEVGILFGAMKGIEVTSEICRLGGGYKHKYGKSHGTSLIDALIAATAYKNSLTLIIRNKRHYPMPEIQIEVPY